MIGIGRQTDYASRIVLHLSSLEEGAQVTADEIAKKGLLPAAFIRRIIGRLASAGILCTVRGAGGGVSLARPPREISLLDLVKAMEGGGALNPCVDNPMACPLAADCPVQRAWCGVTAKLSAALETVRFDHLAGRRPHRASPGTGKRKTKERRQR